MKVNVFGNAWLAVCVIGILANPCSVRAMDKTLSWDGGAAVDPQSAEVREAITEKIQAYREKGAAAADQAPASAEAAKPSAFQTMEEYVRHMEGLGKALSSASPDKVRGLFQLSDSECRDAETKALEEKVRPLLDEKEAPGRAEVKTEEEWRRLKALIGRGQVAHAAAVAALSRQMDKATESAQAKAIVAEMAEHNHRVTRFGSWLLKL